MVTDCVFCYGDIDGCCFCDHSGKIEVGENGFFKHESELEPFLVDTPKESDFRKVFLAGGFNELKGKLQLSKGSNKTE
jgi:hypothetical protein